MSVKPKTSRKELDNKSKFNSNLCEKEIFDIRGVKVLTKPDWERIQLNLRKWEIAAQIEQQERDKKEGIRQCSHNMIKNWTNTVLKGSGARQKKLAERKKRLDEEENKRIAVDKAEAIYQAEQRRVLIEKAKIKQYNQTDRVKNLHSALLFTEVLKEREAQIELKYLKDLAECNRDTGYVAKARREYEQALKEDQERTATRLLKTKENSEFIKSQILYNHERREKEIAEFLLDGENIRRIAADHALAQRRLDQIERDEQKERMRDNLRQIDDVNRLKLIAKLKNEEDDEEIRIFAAAKKKMIKLRIEREDEISREKQENLEKSKKRLTAELLAKMDDEDKRIKNAVIEKEIQYQADESEKNQKRKDMQKSIDDFRTETYNRIELEKQTNKQRDIESLREMRESDVVLNEYETKRKALRREDFIKLAEDNMAIAKEIKEKDSYSRDNRLRAEKENQFLLDLEEKVFQEYAQNIIEHCKKGNRNTYPLNVAATRGFGGCLSTVLADAVKPSNPSSIDKRIELPNGHGRPILN